jgi:FkbM family methyltransferase
MGRKLGFGLTLPCDVEVRMIMNEISKNSLPYPSIVFDVGANIGEYTAAILHNIDGAQIYSFEPNPNTYVSLKNLLGNHLAVRLFEFGLSSQNFIGQMSEFVANDPSSSIVDQQSSTSVPAEFRNIKDVIVELGISRVDFLKIDTEGMDYEILLSAKSLIPTIRIIQFEISPKSITRCSLRMFFELLHETHELYIFTERGLKPIKEYRFSDETYMGSNYVAILKDATKVL